MDRISHAATERTPRVDFDFASGRFFIGGESYPEDAPAFFGPLLQSLRDFLDGIDGRGVDLTVELVYFNSSTAKALMNMFQMIEGAAAHGRQATIRWRYHEDDDTMEEFGQDFAEDFQHARFELCPLKEALGR